MSYTEDELIGKLKRPSFFEMRRIFLNTECDGQYHEETALYETEIAAFTKNGWTLEEFFADALYVE